MSQRANVSKKIETARVEINQTIFSTLMKALCRNMILHYHRYRSICRQYVEKHIEKKNEIKSNKISSEYFVQFRKIYFCLGGGDNEKGIL